MIWGFYDIEIYLKKSIKLLGASDNKTKNKNWKFGTNIERLVQFAVALKVKFSLIDEKYLLKPNKMKTSFESFLSNEETSRVNKEENIKKAWMKQN